MIASRDVLLPGAMMPLIEHRLEAAATVHRLPAEGWAAFLETCGPRIGAVATGAFGRPVDRPMVDMLPNLELIANFGVGYDTVDVTAAAERGVVVTNTPEVLDEEVADLALGLLLSTLRELPQADRYLREGGWKAGPYRLTRGSLRGRTVGLLGMGRIGQAIARRLQAFDVALAYHARRKADVPYRHYETLVGLAAAVDTLIVIVPGGASTRHIVDAEVLRALGPDGVLVNVARGSVVDEAALVSALRAGTIMAAGLDVFEHEPNVPAALIAMDNVVLLPHVGSASVRTREAMGQLVVDNVLAWLNGAPPLTPVPETPWPGRWGRW